MLEQTAYEIPRQGERPRRLRIAVESERGWRHRGRFSEGIEQLREPPEKRRLGRFSDGLERVSETPEKRHVGRFSDGVERLPETARKLRFGSFADR